MRRLSACSRGALLVHLTCWHRECSVPANAAAPPPNPEAAARPVSLTRNLFPVSPDRVDPNKLPTAEEIEKLLPTMAQLERSIPSAKDMEARYIKHEKAAGAAASPAASEKPPPVAEEYSDGTTSGTPSADKALWPDCDTAEDILNEEKFGREDDPVPPPSPQQVRLAWVALAWGTLYAVIGTCLTSCAVAYGFGFHSWAELKAHVAAKHNRDLAVAKAKGFADDQTGEAQTFFLDLTNPVELPNQLQAIMAAIQDVAERQEREKELEAASGAGKRSKAWQS